LWFRQEEIAAKMATMEETVAEYRKNKRERKVSAMDALILTKKQIRAKQRAA